MALTGTRTYVGFGFGAIQAGLFLHEAFGSGAFRRLVVAEVLPDVVTSLRDAAGHFYVNIACADGTEHARLGPVEIECPTTESGRQHLIEAIAEAEEIGTAIPSVEYYASAGPESLHRILAEGLRKKAACGGPRAVVYAAENHNHAAEILESNVLAVIPEDEQAAVCACVRFLNTVIGKMSGVISDPEVIREQELTPITPGAQRAFLVEAFNHILVAKIHFGETAGESPFRRGIQVFEEKDNLLPFEEAKLYGHNATHALAAYVGAVRGVQQMADLSAIPGVMRFLRTAFIEESGKALIHKYDGVDPLFTDEGYSRYADDLLARMTNPYLHDSVERISRDPARKLGWDDRLIGTLRMALGEGIEPRRYALGAAAALATMDHSILEGDISAQALLASLWKGAVPEEDARERVCDLIEDGLRKLRHWRTAEFPELEFYFRKG